MAVGQNDETLEIQADKVDKNSNSDIQTFYETFDLWSASIGKDSVTVEMNEEINEELMINNFIIFSEDGLIMKDLDFHSIESCKNKILENLPKKINGKEEPNWIYVSMESHVNKSALIEILRFLREQKIDYKFGSEDEFVSKIMKK